MSTLRHIDSAFFRWLAHKGAKRRKRRNEILVSEAREYRSKTARIRITNIKNATVLQSTNT